ncbi:MULTISPECIES: DUF397 domain-containing protein [Streptomyces]|uniref:DUF397 domain-containing protein n=1 Tax=Streptomyces cacaoi TaxID=1898 RepID=A0A4Y3R7A2_STRCI|nr:MULTISPECIES: DUF397 domain-containing protein [Streptomyces]NNG85696.1 DUF397 domain-containing protein [Streptomyces cacaoi]GEB53636.1 hypothetical protein SCA03_61870 [Streptomyces cacaoi]
MTTTGMTWFKSTYSGGDGDNCVEVAMAPSAVRVRDSKDVGQAALSVSSAAWARFVRHTARRSR